MSLPQTTVKLESQMTHYKCVITKMHCLDSLVVVPKISVFILPSLSALKTLLAKVQAGASDEEAASKLLLMHLDDILPALAMSLKALSRDSLLELAIALSACCVVIRTQGGKPTKFDLSGDTADQVQDCFGSDLKALLWLMWESAKHNFGQLFSDVVAEPIAVATTANPQIGD